jgi:predicted phosphodiesterase
MNYRLALLADIHGNLAALEAVLNDIHPYEPLDGILILGDIVCGPDQQAVLRRLVELNAVMIQGNNELALARMAAGTAPNYVYTSKQFALRRWAMNHLEPGELDLVRDLPEQRVFHLPGADPIRMVHGSPRDVNELVLPPCQEKYFYKFQWYTQEKRPAPMEEIFALADEPVTVFGHTHLPWFDRRDGRLGMNPGAVNYPENGFIGAQYALLTWDGYHWQPEFHAVPYDLEAVRRSNEESGFLAASALARIFLKELLSGKDIMPDLFALADRLSEEAGCADLPYIRDDIWDEAVKSFA